MDPTPVYTTSKTQRQNKVKQGDCQVAGRPLFVRLFPELSVAALKAGLDKELALWYELRAINANGSSRLVLNDALAALVEHFDYTQSTAYRLLKAGKGKLWDIKHPPLNALTPGGKTTLLSGRSNHSSGFSTKGSDALKKTPASCRLTVNSGVPESTAPVRGGHSYYSTGWHSTIKIYSLLQIAEYFNTSVFRLSRPVEVKVSDFKGTRGNKTAWLYASFFKPEGSKAKPISRDSIKDATGVKRRQQQRYDKVAGNKRVANFACYQDRQGKLTPIRHLVDGKSRQWLKDRRLGNSYHSRALKAHKGMTKRVNAELRHRSLILGEASCVLKRFFLSARSLIRSSERHDEAFLLVNKRNRLIRGRIEWCIA
ncbi:hypothetical protein ES705_44547 [subsurface metagenome]